MKKTIALLMSLIIFVSACTGGGTTLTQPQTRQMLGEEKPIVSSQEEREMVQNLLDSIDRNDWLEAARILQEIKETNDELYRYIESQYPDLVAALEKQDPSTGTMLFDPYFEQYREYSLEYEENIDQAEEEKSNYIQLLEQYESEGLIEVEDDGSRTIIKDLSMEESLKLIELEIVELNVLKAILKAEKAKKIAYGNQDTTQIQKEIEDVELLLNEDKSRKEILQSMLAWGIDFESEQELILFSALRVLGYTFDVDDARLAPKTYFSGKNLNDYFNLDNKGIFERGIFHLNTALNTFNPFYLFGDLSQSEESWNKFFNSQGAHAILESREIIRSGEASTVEESIDIMKQKSEEIKQQRNSELESKIQNNEDVVVKRGDSVVIPDTYTGKITLNGGMIDITQKTTESGAFHITLGKWGGIVKANPSQFGEVPLYGYGYDNAQEEVEIKTLGGQFISEIAPYLNPKLKQEDYIDELMEDVFSLSTYRYDWFVSFMENDVMIQTGIKLTDSSLSESEKDNLRMEQALSFRQQGYFDLSDSILKTLPSEITLDSDSLVFVEEQDISKYSDKSVENLLSTSTRERWVRYTLPEIGISLINPVQMIVFGTIAKGGAAILSKFAFGRTIMGFTSKIGSTIMNLGGERALLKGFIGLMTQIGEEVIEEGFGMIWEPLEFVAMFINGGGAEFNANVAAEYNHDLVDVFTYTGEIDVEALKANTDYFKEFSSGVYLIRDPSGQLSFWHPEGFDMTQLDIDQGKILVGEELRIAKENYATKKMMELMDQGMLPGDLSIEEWENAGYNVIDTNGDGIPDTPVPMSLDAAINSPAGFYMTVGYEGVGTPRAGLTLEQGMTIKIPRPDAPEYTISAKLEKFYYGHTVITTLSDGRTMILDKDALVEKNRMFGDVRRSISLSSVKSGKTYFINGEKITLRSVQHYPNGVAWVSDALNKKYFVSLDTIYAYNIHLKADAKTSNTEEGAIYEHSTFYNGRWVNVKRIYSDGSYGFERAKVIGKYSDGKIKLQFNDGSYVDHYPYLLKQWQQEAFETDLSNSGWSQGGSTWVENQEFKYMERNGLRPVELNILDQGQYKIAEYKLHITARQENFYEVTNLMKRYFDQNNIAAKVAPDPSYSNKVFTVYPKTEASMRSVVDYAKSINNQYGLSGLSPGEVSNSNLRYELAVPGTGNLIYYTVDHVNGEYYGGDNYWKRIDFMKRTWGQGPLDNYFSSPP